MKEEILVKVNGGDSEIGTIEVTPEQQVIIEAGGQRLEYNNVHFQASYNLASNKAREERREQQIAHQQEILKNRGKMGNNPYHKTGESAE